MLEAILNQLFSLNCCPFFALYRAARMVFHLCRILFYFLCLFFVFCKERWAAMLHRSFYVKFQAGWESKDCEEEKNGLVCCIADIAWSKKIQHSQTKKPHTATVTHPPVPALSCPHLVPVKSSLLLLHPPLLFQESRQSGLTYWKGLLANAGGVWWLSYTVVLHWEKLCYLLEEWKRIWETDSSHAVASLSRVKVDQGEMKAYRFLAKYVLSRKRVLFFQCQHASKLNMFQTYIHKSRVLRIQNICLWNGIIPPWMTQAVTLQQGAG